MEVTWKREPGRTEPKIVVLAGEDSPELQVLLRELNRLPYGPVEAWQGERSRMLLPEEILRFYAQDKGVVAQTREGIYEVRLRLYELEEQLGNRNFARISHSEIVNLGKVTAVDLSIAGTICMTLDGSVRAYASRRYVRQIKDMLKERRRGNR